jgi:hypothetical protein
VHEEVRISDKERMPVLDLEVVHRFRRLERVTADTRTDRPSRVRSSAPGASSAAEVHPCPSTQNG